MIVFVVGNDVQNENATAVATFLEGEPHRFLSLWTLEVSEDAPPSLGHTPPIAPRAVMVLARFPFASTDVVVLPQDNGMLQRAVAGAARRRGARLVLLPDGVITAARMHSLGGVRRWALDRVDEVALRAGLVVGDPGVMGSTVPDLTLLWGRRWADYLNGGRAVVPTAIVGCPRMDSLAGVPPPPDEPRVLICSQPLLVAPSWATCSAPQWYARLEELFGTSDGDPRMRLRLHPREFQDDRVPEVLKSVASRRSMREDIADATLMAAPFSTALLEAAACGRSVVMLPFDAQFAERSKEFAFLAPDWVPAVSWRAMDADSLLDCENVAEQMANDYLANVGGASQAAAEAIRSL
jgi:hypothetical protein